MPETWRTRDRIGRHVVLTDAAWSHIVTKRNGAPPDPSEIRAAVEDPDFVAADAAFPRRESCYRRRRSGAGGRYLKVVVRYHPTPPDGTWAGEVITAYPTRGIKPGEERLPR